jgi:hypothetical protein
MFFFGGVKKKNRTMTFGGGLNDVSFAADPHCC